MPSTWSTIQRVDRSSTSVSDVIAVPIDVVPTITAIVDQTIQAGTATDAIAFMFVSCRPMRDQDPWTALRTTRAFEIARVTLRVLP